MLVRWTHAARLIQDFIEALPHHRSCPSEATLGRFIADPLTARHIVQRIPCNLNPHIEPSIGLRKMVQRAMNLGPQLFVFGLLFWRPLVKIC